MNHPPIYDVVQMLRTPTEKDTTFGSRRHHFPRQKLTLDVNHAAMDFFKKMSSGENVIDRWDFVDFQHHYRKSNHEEYEELLHSAISWCNNNCEEGDWELAGNDFLFRNQPDAAAFIWNFFD